MFSVTRFKGSLSVRQGGFSLIEIVASALLIAAIAVLAFPTFKDFKPHEADEVRSEQQPDQEQADLTEAVAAATRNQEQPVVPESSRSKDLEKASLAESDSLD